MSSEDEKSGFVIVIGSDNLNQFLTPVTFHVLKPESTLSVIVMAAFIRLARGWSCHQMAFVTKW
jgi:hypothetical protein